MRTNPNGTPADSTALDPEVCWRAWVRRDRRFEGHFFMGVATTGIYCRPGCPARLPARRNVSFYPSAAAAEGAGFRPCQRCRPETAPGSPAAAGTSAIVGRALRLIEGGALDTGSVEDLAARLGVTSRWLRQLFVTRLGAAPLAVAQTHRAHLARRLIESSTMPMEDVAAATGFGSARRLRHSLRRTFGRPARALRGRNPSRAAGLSLALRARGPFDPDPIFAFLAPRAIPGVEETRPGLWRRAVAWPAGAGIVEVRASAARDGLEVRILPPAPGAVTDVVGRVSRMFDLNADARGIAAELRRDSLLRRWMPAAGLRVPGSWDAFEMGVRAIVGQQISVVGARTILGRLVERCGSPLAFADPGLARTFPGAAAIAACDLEGLGLTRARAATLRSFAGEIARGALDLDALPDLDTAVARLLRLPGIGDWTAHEIALRGLAEPDAFPAGDLGLRRALTRAGKMPGAREVRARAERWRPWRAYAATALWAADPGLPKRDPERTEKREPRKESKS